MSRKTSLQPISRRRFVGGTLAGGALVGGAAFIGLNSPASGVFMPEKFSAGAVAGGAGGTCSHLHAAMADALSQTIADPSIGAEATARAIRTSFCPCCDTQIGAAARFEASGVAA
ncbi:twin-arginine translocation signal domain-containing protein [Salaquimonas pukyongi]|uniref:twin-arginine translocation signal domain-containing protein n=1 Tax=Salaquimonas pukyongi TaxID=2712698 RepID=UPI00096B82FF|nr:twin-arginine translocation signal domain-containing protein [Salaquimonas pukyongi]